MEMITGFKSFMSVMSVMRIMSSERHTCHITLFLSQCVSFQVELPSSLIAYFGLEKSGGLVVSFPKNQLLTLNQ